MCFFFFTTIFFSNTCELLDNQRALRFSWVGAVDVCYCLYDRMIRVCDIGLIEECAQWWSNFFSICLNVALKPIWIWFAIWTHFMGRRMARVNKGMTEKNEICYRSRGNILDSFLFRCSFYSACKKQSKFKSLFLARQFRIDMIFNQVFNASNHLSLYLVRPCGKETFFSTLKLLFTQ